MYRVRTAESEGTGGRAALNRLNFTQQISILSSTAHLAEAWASSSLPTARRGSGMWLLGCRRAVATALLAFCATYADGQTHATINPTANTTANLTAGSLGLGCLSVARADGTWYSAVLCDPSRTGRFLQNLPLGLTWRCGRILAAGTPIDVLQGFDYRSTDNATSSDGCWQGLRQLGITAPGQGTNPPHAITCGLEDAAVVQLGPSATGCEGLADMESLLAGTRTTLVENGPLVPALTCRNGSSVLTFGLRTTFPRVDVSELLFYLSMSGSTGEWCVRRLGTTGLSGAWCEDLIPTELGCEWTRSQQQQLMVSAHDQSTGVAALPYMGAGVASCGALLFPSAGRRRQQPCDGASFLGWGSSGSHLDSLPHPATLAPTTAPAVSPTAPPTGATTELPTAAPTARPRCTVDEDCGAGSFCDLYPDQLCISCAVCRGTTTCPSWCEKEPSPGSDTASSNTDNTDSATWAIVAGVIVILLLGIAGTLRWRRVQARRTALAAGGYAPGLAANQAMPIVWREEHRSDRGGSIAKPAYASPPEYTVPGDGGP